MPFLSPPYYLLIYYPKSDANLSGGITFLFVCFKCECMLSTGQLWKQTCTGISLWYSFVSLVWRWFSLKPKHVADKAKHSSWYSSLDWRATVLEPSVLLKWAKDQLYQASQKTSCENFMQNIEYRGHYNRLRIDLKQLSILLIFKDD
jgi:hypothetical protein